MKVLSLTNEFEEECFGGAGTAATGIVYMLDRLGVQQTVIVPCSAWGQPGRFERGQQIKGIGLPRNFYYFGHLEMVLTQPLHRRFPELWQEWDIIHLQAVNFAPLANLLSNGKIPILYSVYSFLREELGDRKGSRLQERFQVQEELLGRCQRIHLVSHSERDYLAGHFPQYLSKAEELPLGISLPAERWQPGNSERFLYVGRLLDYKGVEDLIWAAAKAAQCGRQIYLDIVGKGTRAYEKYLNQMVNSLGLGAYVQFHGWKSNSEVKKLMAQAKALVVPSRREAFGLVALEGMAIGTPLIASQVGGLAELVSSACALTFEAGNREQLSETLLMAFNYPSLLQLLSERAKERATLYEWGQLAPRYLKLFESTQDSKSC